MTAAAWTFASGRPRAVGLVTGALAGALLAPCGLALGAPEVGAGPRATGTDLVRYCHGPEPGLLSGGIVEVAREAPAAIIRERGVTTLRSDTHVNRVNLIIVGDGYTEPQLALFHAHTDAFLDDAFSEPPLLNYLPYFAVHRIDVVSNESGVSNDPSPGINRDTALGMRYWCNNIERLLCVNVSSAYAYANQAPAWDQIVALANSTKYGGAGYPSANVGTAAGDNIWSAEIVVHELGHSLGNLADEYDYGGGVNYTGPEPGPYNVSTLQAPQMLAAGTKWAPWLGENNPQFDGLIGTFEGAHYYVQGIYRPTNNSKMRSLGRPFNLPSAQEMIREIYRIVSPINAWHPDTSVTLGAGDIVTVEPMRPDGHDLEIRWFLNGTPLEDADGEEAISLHAVPPGSYTLTARVWDPTFMVRDEAARDALMTDEVSWAVEIGADCPVDFAPPYGVLDVFDVIAFLALFEDEAPEADLAPPFGVWDVFDVIEFLTLFEAGCP